MSSLQEQAASLSLAGEELKRQQEIKEAEEQVPESWRGQEYICMNCEDLAEVPNWLRGCHAHLKVLVMDRCNIARLPDWFKELEQLEALSLNGNKLEEVPSCVLLLPRLTDLDLSRNKITRVPEWVGTMQQLNSLYLNDNPLKDVPSEVSALCFIRLW